MDNRTDAEIDVNFFWDEYHNNDDFTKGNFEDAMLFYSTLSRVHMAIATERQAAALERIAAVLERAENLSKMFDEKP